MAKAKSPAALLVALRWAKTTKRERRLMAMRMVEAKKAKRKEKDNA